MLSFLSIMKEPFILIINGIPITSPLFAFVSVRFDRVNQPIITFLPIMMLCSGIWQLPAAFDFVSSQICIVMSTQVNQ